MKTDQPFSILLVEDNPDDATLALHALGSAGFGGVVRWVSDGTEVMDLLFGPGGAAARAELRLILLDVKLPLVSGPELLGLIRKAPGGQAIPVVMLTSSGEERDVAACYELGANAYLVKPVDFNQLADLVVRAAEFWVDLNTLPGKASQGPGSPAGNGARRGG